MSEATVTIEDVEKNMKIVHLQGQLDESNIDEKIKIVYQCLEVAGAGLRLIFDFSSLDYMNSKSIGYLTDIYGKVSEGGGMVVIVGAKPNIADILQVVGLTQIIECVATVDEAKRKIESIVGNSSVPPVATTEAATVEMNEPKATQKSVSATACEPSASDDTVATSAHVQTQKPEAKESSEEVAVDVPAPSMQAAEDVNAVGAPAPSVQSAEAVKAVGAETLPAPSVQADGAVPAPAPENAKTASEPVGTTANVAPTPSAGGQNQSSPSQPSSDEGIYKFENQQ